MKLSLMPTWTCSGPTGCHWCHHLAEDVEHPVDDAEDPGDGLEPLKEMIWSFVGWWGLRTLGDVPRTYSGVMTLGHFLVLDDDLDTLDKVMESLEVGIWPSCIGHLSLDLDKALEACGDLSWLWKKYLTLKTWWIPLAHDETWFAHLLIEEYFLYSMSAQK